MLFVALACTAVIAWLCLVSEGIVGLAFCRPVLLVVSASVFSWFRGPVLGCQSVVAPACVISWPCGMSTVRGGSACGPSTLWRSEVAVLAHGATPLASFEPLSRRLPFSRVLSSPSHRALLPSRLSSPSLRAAPSPAMPAELRSPSHPLAPRYPLEGRRVSTGRCVSSETQGFLEPFNAEGDGSLPVQDIRQSEIGLLRILSGANSFIPHIVLGSTVLALAYPPSFTWFTTRYYAPALGFLMFAVGINSSPKDFIEAINRPGALFTGYAGQFVIKPLLGYLFGALSVTAFQLPSSLGAGIMLVSCVSGAQLSNYATFLTDPAMAPLSIVMTSLSTATAVFVTPALSLLLIGKKLPVDVRGMMSSITQIVVVPIAAGLLLNRHVVLCFLLLLLPRVCAAIQPFLPPLSVLVTALCVGSPLAINVEAIVSPFGITVLLLILGFHASSFVAGYFLPALLFHKAPDVKALQRTISFETGMQSSLLALALANRFFQDPLVGVPPAISNTVVAKSGHLGP
ncbi:hypothetical protein Taro_042908 [Colocasia esculenta]|uniref:Uncharacterized protein n=1 Tax=Colocasia esculenta TaxID=4460 RepID=A0A843WQ13_COLES|nr:hypothetical protein [Colocasia esculenta]